MLDSQIMLPPLPVQGGVRFASLPFDGRYCVSDDGRVFSCAKSGSNSSVCDSWRELKHDIGAEGYHRVGIAGVMRAIHRLALLSFIGAPGPGEECRHLNGMPGDNRLVNLAWGSRAENIRDKVRHGTDPNGERNTNAKLTNAEVALCRQLRARHPGRSGIGKFLARWHGVNKGSISEIFRGKRFKQERC